MLREEQTSNVTFGSWYSAIVSALVLDRLSHAAGGQVQGRGRGGPPNPNSMPGPQFCLDQLSSGNRQPYLVIVAGIGIGRAFPVKERTHIGRDPDGDVVLPSRTISYHHLIVSHQDGAVVAEDLGSRNGTFVGLEKVKRRKLVEGDVLAVGDSVLLKLVFATAPDGPESTLSYLLPPDPMTGVENAASLLEKLRKEKESAPTGGDPLTLIWYRVDGLGECEELSLIEKAMRVVAVAILQAMKGETLLARSADGEFLAMARATTKTSCKMAAHACEGVSKQVARGSCPAPLLLVAAVVPLSTAAPADAETILAMARKKAYSAMADVPMGVVTTDPVGAQGRE
jgi:pSer/pThr/pTyr-binding forkhead associated (FHA) protein